MIVEELISKLGLEVDPEAFKVLEEFHHAIEHGIGIAVGAAAVAFAALVGETAEAAKAMGHSAEMLGENVERLGELKFAADRSEVSFESLSQGLKFLGKNAVEAANGNFELRKAFGDVALHNADGKIRSSSDLLEDLADRFQKLPDYAHQANYAMKLFGRGGIELLPMLKKGRAGIDELKQEAHKLGIIFTEEDVAGAREFDEGLKDMRDSLLGLRNAFATQFFTAFAEVFRAIAGLFVRARPYVAKFGLAIRQVAAEFWAIVKPIRQVIGYFADLFGNSVIAKWLSGIDTFSALKALMLGLAVVAGILAAEFLWSAASAIAAWLAAAAPFILIGALIGFIVDDIYRFIKGNDSLIGRIQKWAEAAGDPDEHPLVKLLRKALALLLDVTDPKRWDDFKGAVGNAVDFVSEKVRTFFGGKKFVKVNGQNIAEDVVNNTTGTPDQGGVFGQGGILDSLGFHRKGYEDLAAKGSTTSTGYGLGADVTRLQAPGANVTNHVTINGSGLDKDQLQGAVQDALDSSNAKALAAVSGGEK